MHMECGGAEDVNGAHEGEEAREESGSAGAEAVEGFRSTGAGSEAQGCGIALVVAALDGRDR